MFPYHFALLQIQNSIIHTKRYRGTFLRSNINISTKKRNELDYLTTLYPTLGDAYRLKEIFYRCANLKVQLAKRRAIGYRNIKNFINMIFLTCGKLKFDYPHKTL